MWARLRPLLAASIACALATQASAAEPTIHWQTTLEGAKRLASQTNHLVLIHFWHPQCQPCLIMEHEVFPQPAVVQAVSANYVPVKLNTYYFPSAVRQYGVAQLPSDVIITPQGQFIQKLVGLQSAADYVAGLNQIASVARPQATAIYAEVPGPGSPAPQRPVIGQPGLAPPSPANPNPAGVATPVAALTGPGPGSQANASLAPSRTSPSAAVREPLDLDGFCPVRLAEKKQWVPGDRRFGAIHRGRTYLFAGAEEQKKFLLSPDSYAPVLSGMDVVLAVERGQLIPGSRETGVFYADRVYLFAGDESLQKFARAPEQYVCAVLQAYRMPPGSAR